MHRFAEEKGCDSKISPATPNCTGCGLNWKDKIGFSKITQKSLELAVKTTFLPIISAI